MSASEQAVVADREKLARDWTYVREVRENLVSEHRRWSDSVFSFLVLGNTGGTAIIASLLRDSHGQAAKWLLTSFILGVILSLVSIYHEWRDARTRLLKWDANSAQLKLGKKTLEGMLNDDAELAKITLLDQVIGWAPGVLFLVTTLSSLFWLWFSFSVGPATK